ncbi:MAG: [FeFe] hydrogenase H-cluster maturation GTPase HydF [Sedimentisphaerales bacterium]|nr:[FeFe] hydrogenase H-cluster maturation GTPase HydF [Sedimentisphaerales bacterium]
MQRTPKGLRLHVGIFGRRNAGKSSFLNAMTSQDVSIVSDVAGTTTDPVEKAMEMLPLGPVLFIDTAGIDDTGALGEQRISKTLAAIDRTDIAVILITPEGWGRYEMDFIESFQKAEIPVVAVLNKSDLGPPCPEAVDYLQERKLPVLRMSCTQATGVAEFRKTLLRIAPDSFLQPPTIVGDLAQPGEMVVLVVPIDLEAPKGRLILPQVQTIRDTLDSDLTCAITKERELRSLLDNLKHKPALVVTDSQAFLKVAGDTPTDIPITSFSILFARNKGDLQTFVDGVRVIDQLKSGDKVLIAEACTHHPIGEDIGRVKMPRWMSQYVGGKLHFDVTSGSEFPENLSEYELVIHCGSCMFNRRQVLTRILKCREAGVPITNYGLCIAYSLGIFERALGPFQHLLDGNA